MVDSQDAAKGDEPTRYLHEAREAGRLCYAAAGFTLNQLQVLTAYLPLDREPCYLPEEVEAKLGHEEGGDA